MSLRAHFHDDWIHTKKPIIYKGKDRRILTDDLTAHWSVWEIRVKAGYSTDGASIPRAAWRVIGHPFQRYEAAAIIHDALYDSEHWQREQIDDCFRDLLRACGVGKMRRAVIYRAVRLFGGMTWKKHTQESIANAKQFVAVSYA